MVATTLSPGAAIAGGTCADAALASASTAGTDKRKLRRNMRMGPSSSVRGCPGPAESSA